MPKISVVMPVYNGEKFLREAIDSILNQTFSDFEFIIINDASTDSTEDIIKSYDDKRIVYLKNSSNLGVACSLNNGLDIARGEYIARMDADDISLPERFAKQVAFMDKHKDIGVCGTWIEFFGERKGIFKNTVGKKQTKIDMLFSSCIAHPSVIIRKAILEKYDFFYNKNYEQVEDYELWCRISRHYDIDNIPEALLKYRCHDKQVTQNITTDFIEKMGTLKKNILLYYNVDFTRPELEAYTKYCLGISLGKKENRYLFNLLEKIYIINNNNFFFDKLTLRNTFKTILIRYIQLNKDCAKELCKNYSYINMIDIYLYKIKTLLGNTVRRV